VSLLLAATIAAVAAAASYLAVRKKSATDQRGASPPPIAHLEPKKPDRFANLPLALGDVVSADGSERWLAGACVGIDRDVVIGVLFFAPEGAKEKAVMVHAPPDRSILWLAEAEAIAATDEPPATLELERTTLVRKRRVPVRLERVGHGVPELAETALWAIYEGPARDVAVVIAFGQTALAWKGTRYLEGEYDRLGPAGDG